MTDSSGNTTTNNWDETKGLLNSTTDPKGNITNNTYDPNTDNLKTVTKYIDSNGNVATNVYTYENNSIKTISEGSTKYTFGYDSLGNNTSVAVGSQNLITNNYEQYTDSNNVSRNTGRLESSTYGNGQVVKNDYDSLDRLIGREYNGSQQYSFQYDGSGNMGYENDIVNGVQYRYIYDNANRLVNIADSKNNILGYGFDNNNNTSTVSDEINGIAYKKNYQYDKDNKQVSVKYTRPEYYNGTVEYFPLNGTGAGSKGTNPSSQNAAYQKDINGETMFSSYGSNTMMYKLNGLSSSAGTEAMWFNTTGSGTRQVIANEAASGYLLNSYIDTDGKLKLAVNSSTGTWTILASSASVINNSQWHFVAISWNTSGSTLNVSLYIDGASAITGSITGFRDFSGATTAVGSSIGGSYQLNGTIKGFSYAATQLTASQIQGLYQNEIDYNYDGIGRLNKTIINTTGAQNYTTSYNYLAGVNGSTTNKISSIVNDSSNPNGGSTINYTYDKNGNIYTITNSAGTITYTYDNLNELTREDNGVLNETIVYTYDTLGNLQTKVEYPLNNLTTPTKTHSYSYTNSNWGDELLGYDGNVISYDTIGNLQSYNGWTYSWQNGRQLATANANGYNISYKYNSDGIRTQKTVNGVTTNYHLEGNNVTYEENGTDKIYYTYDSKGSLVSMNLNDEEYYYERNAQGDIIGLIDRTGIQVASYTYDSWGKLISIKDQSGSDITNNTSSVGYKNPYRYRGYRYDTETGLYYLQARYYNPEWGRFINADALAGTPGELLSSNVFAYCKNNPVNMGDPSGYLADFSYDDGNRADGTISDFIEGVVATVACTLAVFDAIAAVPLGIGYYFGNYSEDVVEKESNVVENVSHGNSKLSTKSQHGYEIYEKESGDVVKTGISGRPLNKNGTSPRANILVNKLNNEARFEKYAARVVNTNLPNRQAALDWEENNAMSLYDAGNSMSIHKRPIPWDK